MTPEERSLLRQLASLAKQARECRARMDALYSDFKNRSKHPEEPSPKIIKQIEETLQRYRESMNEDGA